MTKAKNDTTAVTASIMAASANKEKKDTSKPAAKPAAKAEGKPEDTAVALSTDAFSKEILTEYQKRTKAIRAYIGKIDKSFESIAFNLHWINAKQAYKAEGHASIVEYAAENFGYQKTTCYSLIGVVDRFARRDEKGALMEVFDDRVKGYSVSKLSLMCSLTDAEIDTLSPSMSVRDIKRFVKSLEGQALPELSEGSGNPEGGDGTAENAGAGDNAAADVKAVVVSNTLISIRGMGEYSNKSDRIGEYIQRVFNHYPDAVIDISYSVPSGKGEK